MTNKKTKLTPPKVRANKGKTPLVCLTAYTAPMAKAFDGCADILLVGDSLGMVLYGMPSTLPVDLQTMIRHGKAVSDAAQSAMVVVDMPFGSYQESREKAFSAAAKIMKKTGCAAVKLEGGVEMAPTIEFLTKRCIPVMAHIGLMPQSSATMGGYKVQGRDGAQALIADAKAVEAAGAFAVVIEGVAQDASCKITKSVNIPTVGIGACSACDGQILVSDDMLGLLPEKSPKFVKRYANLFDDIKAAAKEYADDVRARKFPSDEHTY